MVFFREFCYSHVQVGTSRAKAQDRRALCRRECVMYKGALCRRDTFYATSCASEIRHTALRRRVRFPSIGGEGRKNAALPLQGETLVVLLSWSGRLKGCPSRSL